MGAVEITKLVVITVVSVGVLVLVTFRYRTQHRKNRPSKARLAEDIFVGLATAGGVCVYAMQIWCITAWMKYEHSKDPTIIKEIGMPPKDAAVWRKLALVDDYLYIFILWNIKAAFMTIQYDMSRILPRWHRTLIYSNSGYMVVSFFISFFMGIVNCRKNLPAMWSYTGYHCSAFTEPHLLLMQYLLNIFGDIFILSLYVLLIRSLRIKGRQIWAFAFIFVLTLLTITASTLRYVKIRLQIDSEAGTTVTMKNFVALAIWKAVEWVTALVAVCLPALRTQFRERTESSNRSSSFKFQMPSGWTLTRRSEMGTIGEEIGLQKVEREVHAEEVDEELHILRPRSSQINILERELSRSTENTVDARGSEIVAVS